MWLSKHPEPKKTWLSPAREFQILPVSSIAMTGGAPSMYSWPALLSPGQDRPDQGEVMLRATHAVSWAPSNNNPVARKPLMSDPLFSPLALAYYQDYRNEHPVRTM